MREALLRAIKNCGTQEAVAELLGIGQSAVSWWVTKDGKVPVKHVLKLEVASGVSRHDLRPDIYPREAA